MPSTLITFLLISISIPCLTSQPTKPTNISTTTLSNSTTTSNTSQKLDSPSIYKLIITANTTLLSKNNTFQLGFFHTNNESKWYLGIWYKSIPTPTYVWVANRENPVKIISTASCVITSDGKLAVREKTNIVWQTTNAEKAVDVQVQEQGNLVLFNYRRTSIVWQSFDHPTDTWLPGMNLTRQLYLSSWKSSTDPSPGNYSLRLAPPEYGEIDLVFNGSVSYWSTGKWTGNAFSGVPEMTMPYIYYFHFANAFTPMASFGFTERSVERGLTPPLTRFQVDFTGQVRQYTWAPQTVSWDMFWSRPEDVCRVYGRCGNLGFCNPRISPCCKCLEGFSPVDGDSWDSGDFSGGCRHEGDGVCGENDGFEGVGVVNYDGGVVVSFTASRDVCESKCLSNCSCIGLCHNEITNACKNLFGSLFNLRNVSTISTIDDVLYLRVKKKGITKTKIDKALVFITTSCGFTVVLIVVGVILLVLRRKRVKRKNGREKEQSLFPVRNLMVFSYKELHIATRGFSDKLGHGGFGAVFHGELSDSSRVAVKRLERPGGGESEFQAEVCTIGNIHHVNLVRLRGFCSESAHRLLVYDYMPNGPLSVYLKRDGQSLNWDVRFRVAIGTARGIAYLHEGCRNCIIHCDIKPENILLDEDFSAMVSDFGLAKLLGRDFSRVLATMRGTWGYVAPEWISGVAITTKADVYSYGMTLLELIGGRRNVEGPPSAGGGCEVGTEGKWFFPPWAARQIIEGNVAAVVDERLGGAYNIEEAERVGLVAVWCIQDDEAMRPTMGMVVKMLEGVVEVTLPPPPKLLQALVSGGSFNGVGANSGNQVLSGGGDGCFEDIVRSARNSKGSQ